LIKTACYTYRSIVAGLAGFIMIIDDFSAYCVYTHDINGSIFYVGMGTLSRAYSGEGRTHSWHDYHDKRSVNVEIIAWFGDDKKRAADYEKILIKYYRPRCNFHHNTRKAYRGPVTCLETGARFVNASDAARKLNVKQSQMSNHLNGKPGYITVKGFHFLRGIHDL
jgi:hypothetical protein